MITDGRIGYNILNSKYVHSKKIVCLPTYRNFITFIISYELLSIEVKVFIWKAKNRVRGITGHSIGHRNINSKGRIWYIDIGCYDNIWAVKILNSIENLHLLRKMPIRKENLDKDSKPGFYREANDLQWLCGKIGILCPQRR